MKLSDVVTKTSNRHTGDILSAIWHLMLFMGLRGFTGKLEIDFKGGRVSGLKENGESIDLDVHAINRKIRLGKCSREQEDTL